MKKWLVLFFVVVALATLAAAEEKKHPIDVQIDQMTSQDQSTNGQVQAFAKGYDLWDEELNRVYKELMKALGNDDAAKKALKESQKAWIQFRDLEFKALQALYAKKDGSMFRPMQVCDRMQLVRNRARELADQLNILKEF